MTLSAGRTLGRYVPFYGRKYANLKTIIDLNKAKNLFVEHREEIREVFGRAVQQTLLEHKRAGNPVAALEIWI